jgi:hypothetical protein
VLIGRSPGRPTHRPGVLAVVLLALLAGCARKQEQPPAVPDVVDPGWRLSGELEIRFTVRKPQATDAPRLLRVHAVLTVDDPGRVRAMRTVQSGDGVVLSRTDWAGGATTTVARWPGCAAVSDPAVLQHGVAGWLAEPFGPVDAATADGWTVADGTATRPGSLVGTEERAPLTALTERTVRQVQPDSGAVLTEVGDITVRHATSAPPLPACGAAESA